MCVSKECSVNVVLNARDKSVSWFENVACSFEFLNDFFNFAFSYAFCAGGFHEVFEGYGFSNFVLKVRNNFFYADDFVSLACGHFCGYSVDVNGSGFFVEGNLAQAVVK